MRYLLDSSFASLLLEKPDEALLEKLEGHKPGHFLLCSIVKADLLEKARMSKKMEDNLLLLHKFFSQFKSLDFDDKAASFYGNILAQLQKSDSGFMGTLFSKAKSSITHKDVMIASIAQAHDLVLLTKQPKVFAQIPGLRMESW